MSDILPRFLVAATLLLTVGILLSAVLRQRRGTMAATFVQRVTLLSLPIAALLGILAGLPHVSELTPPPLLPTAPLPAFVAPQSSPESETAVSVADIKTPAAHSLTISDQSRVSLPSPLTMALGIWVIGTTLGFARLGGGAILLGRLRRTGSGKVLAPTLHIAEAVATAVGVRTPLLRLHAGTNAPFLAGILRPVLYLPMLSTTDETQLRTMLAHEMGHLQRRDLLWNLTARVATALLWWHPLVHVLARRMEQTAEEACDEIALHYGAVKANAYATLLLDLSERVSPAPALLTVGISSFRSQMGRRIARVLSGVVVSLPLSRPTQIAVTLGTLFLAMLGVLLVGKGVRSEPPPTMTSAEWRKIFYQSGLRSTGGGNVAVIAVVDFECPACRKGYLEILRPLARNERIILNFLNLPLPQHRLAMKAAIAADAVSQNLQLARYFDAVDALMLPGETPLTEQAIQDLPNRLHLNALERRQYENAFTNARMDVERDVATAKKQHIESTPTYLILNGRTEKVTIAVGNQELRSALDTPALRDEIARPGMDNILTPFQRMMRPVTLSLKGADVRGTLESVMTKAGVRHRIAPGVRGKVSLDLKGVTLSVAIGRITAKANPPAGITIEKEIVNIRPLPPTGSVTGSVVYPDGRPAAGVTVMAGMLRSHLANQAHNGRDYTAELVTGAVTVTGSDGKYVLDRLGAYRYNISVMMFGAEAVRSEEYFRQEEKVKWVAASLEGVVPRPAHSTVLPTIRLTHGAIIEGLLLDEKGRGVPNISIGSHGPHRPETSSMVNMVRTDATGHFRMRVAPGRSIIYIAQNDFPPERTHITTDADDKPDTGVYSSQAHVYVTLAEGETRHITFQREN